VTLDGEPDPEAGPVDSDLVLILGASDQDRPGEGDLPETVAIGANLAHLVRVETGGSGTLSAAAYREDDGAFTAVSFETAALNFDEEPSLSFYGAEELNFFLEVDRVSEPDSAASLRGLLDALMVIRGEKPGG
jgi:hypothetical protein